MIEEHACLRTFFTARVLGAWTDITNFNATKRKFRQMQGIKRQMHYIHFSAPLSTHQNTPQHYTPRPAMQQPISSGKQPKEPTLGQAVLPERCCGSYWLHQDSKRSLSSWQLYSRCSQPQIPTPEDYPQLINVFHSQEGQLRLGTKCTGLRPCLWPSTCVSQSLLGSVHQEISYV